MKKESTFSKADQFVLLLLFIAFFLIYCDKPERKIFVLSKKSWPAAEKFKDCIKAGFDYPNRNV